MEIMTNLASMLYHIYFILIFSFFFSLQVFTANNVELVTKTRTEHLTGKDKLKAKKSSSKTPLESFLGTAEETITNTSNSTSLEGVSIRNGFYVDINVGSNLNLECSLRGKECGGQNEMYLWSPVGFKVPTKYVVVSLSTKL